MPSHACLPSRCVGAIHRGASRLLFAGRSHAVANCHQPCPVSSPGPAAFNRNPLPLRIGIHINKCLSNNHDLPTMTTASRLTLFSQLARPVHSSLARLGGAVAHLGGRLLGCRAMGAVWHGESSEVLLHVMA